MSRLAVLPPRPPTPPKETVAGMGSENSIEKVELPVLSHRSSAAVLDTPDNSPGNLGLEHPQNTSDKHSKRVGFLMGPGGATPVTTSSPENPGHNSANKCSGKARQLKSILKQPSYPLFDSLNRAPANEQPPNVPRMLEGICQQLARQSVSCRLDAYVSLNGCLKTYKTKATLDALKEKSSLLSDFVQRDLSRAKEEDDVRNIQVALEALRLVNILIWSPMAGEILPVNLQTFVLDQAISTVARETKSKQLVNQYLYFLSLQNFRASVMTNERANKILTHLKSVSDRIAGKQVIAHRLAVYKKLILQMRQVMLSRVNDWIYHLFHGMISENREIRSRAVYTSLEAAELLGSEINISKAVKDCFKSEVQSEEGSLRYGDVFINRLTQWLESKDDARFVPQIWGIIVLLLCHPPRNVERWSFIVPWLKLIQKCFNASDAEIKIEANRAWERFIYAICPDGQTGSNMIALLRDPITPQLQRSRVTDKESKRIRLTTYNVYNTLLYYAFRPGQDPTTVSRHWDAYVVKVISNASSMDVAMISGALGSLFGSSQPNSWSSNRVFSQLPIKRNEIPRLDPKWVRSEASSILKLMEQLLKLDAWWNPQDGDVPILVVWKAMSKAINEAGAKEIKVSMEAMTAMAEILGTVKQFHSHAIARQPRHCMPRTLALVKSSVANLGTLLFNEKRLIKKSSGSYLVAQTPSSRSTKPTGELLSPTEHLIRFLSEDLSGDLIGDDFINLLSILLEVALQAVSSRRSKLRILRETTSYFSCRKDQAMATNVALWHVLVEFTRNTISIKPAEEPNTEKPFYAGQDFREAVKILEFGFQLSSKDVSDSWIQALEIVSHQAQFEAGVAGKALAITEPLAKTMVDRMRAGDQESYEPFVLSLLNHATWPASPTEVETSHRVLWGSNNNHSRKSAEFVLYEHLPTLINEVFDKVFNKKEYESHEGLSSLFQSLTHFISIAPASTYASIVLALQGSFASVFADTKAILHTKTTGSKEAFGAAARLWELVLERCEKLGIIHQDNAFEFQELLCTGLTSRHKLFANQTINFWNSTLGLVENIQDIPNLEEALRHLSKVTDVLFAGALVESNHVQGHQIQYYDTPASIAHMDHEVQLRSPYQAASNNAGPNHSDRKAQTATQVAQSTPRRTRRISINSTPRLRHDSSQIQFAVVDSSPSKLESQLLTEHQMEVKERQEMDANAMFADLRSSTKAKPTQGKVISQPRLSLSSDHIGELSNSEEVQSPNLPEQDDGVLFNSSPTPSQRRSSSRETPRSMIPRGENGGDYMARRLSPDFPSSPPVVLKDSKRDRREKNEMNDQNAYGDSSTEMPRYPLPPPQNRRSSIDQERSNITSRQSSELDEGHNRLQLELNSVEAQILIDMQKAVSQSQESESQSQVPELGHDRAESRIKGKRKASSVEADSARRKKSRGRPRKRSEQGVKASNSEEEEVLDTIVLSGKGVTKSAPSRPTIKRSAPEDGNGMSDNQELPPQKRNKMEAEDVDIVILRSDLRASSSDAESITWPAVSVSVDNDEQVEEVETLGKKNDAPAETSGGCGGCAVDAEPQGTEVSENDVTAEGQADGDMILGEVRALLKKVHTAKLGSSCDEIMATLMEVGREVMEAKRRTI